LPSTNHRGSAFPFHKYILEAGIWRKLRPSAKALYPVMRHFGFFDFEVYSEIEDVDYAADDAFANREYDFCEADRNALIEYSGIHRNSLNPALRDLEDNFLIEPIGDDGWKVFLRSKGNTIWKRDYLNKKVMRSYQHILSCTKTTGNDAQKLPKDAQMGSGR
jgi:hypothetical protein